MRKLVTAALSLSSLVALSCVTPAISLAAPCDGVDSEQPFTAWHDQASYVLASGGDFESAAADWALTGDAAVVPGGAPFRADSSANSLSLPAGASATTPPICVGKGDPVARLFIRSLASGKGGPDGLRVHVLYLNASGDVRKVKKAGQLRGTGDWAPTRRFSLAQGQFNHASKPPEQTGPGNGPSGGPPGQSGDPHGPSGGPPGQSGDPHGPSGGPPGQSGDPHGQGGGGSPTDPPHGQGGNNGQGGHGHGAATSGRSGSIQLRFTAGAGSEWQIDDVFVDPRARY